MRKISAEQTKTRFLSIEEELAIVKKAERGDRKAREKLYEYFSMAIKGYIAGRIGDPYLAQDYVHETFINAYEGLVAGEYNPQYRFYTYLRKIANKIIRKNRIRSTREIFFDDLIKDAPEDKRGNIYKGLAVSSDEERFLKKELVEGLLWIVANSCAKPHQILCFLYLTFLFWKPSEVVKQRSLYTLDKLKKDFITEYLSYLEHCTVREEIEKVLQPLESKLGSRVKDIYFEHEYKSYFEKRLNNIVGALLLKDFFRGRKPAVSISDWSHRVGERAKNIAEGGILCLEKKGKFQE